jgi:hypothetical protein
MKTVVKLHIYFIPYFAILKNYIKKWPGVALFAGKE